VPELCTVQVEYRGTYDQTLFGFDNLDEKLWVPEYDMWTTTVHSNDTTSTTSRIDRADGQSSQTALIFLFFILRQQLYDTVDMVTISAKKLPTVKI
jgi:hypothetical protein